MTTEYLLKRKEISNMLYDEYKKENLNDRNFLIESEFLQIINNPGSFDNPKTPNFINFITNKIKLIKNQNIYNFKYPDYLNCTCSKIINNSQWVINCRCKTNCRRIAKCSCVICLDLLKEPFLEPLPNGANLRVDFYTFQLMFLIKYYVDLIIFKEKLPKIIEENKLISNEKTKTELEKQTRIKKFVEEERIRIKNEKVNKLIQMTNNYINEKEAISIIINIVNNINFIFTSNIDNYLLKECNSPHQAEKQRQKNDLLESYFQYPRVPQKLFNESERDTLLALQILNKYANDKKIRVEDAKVIFNEYINKI